MPKVIRRSQSRRVAGRPAADTLDQQLKLRGIADVLVVLNQAAGEPLAAAVPGARARSTFGAMALSMSATTVPVATDPAGGLPMDLMSLFESPYEASMEAESASLTLRASGKRKRPVVSPAGGEIVPALYLDRLRMVLGSVSAGGLKGLRRHNLVKRVEAIPDLSLIRPRRLAAAQPTPEINWGLSRLNIPALWKQGLDGEGIKVGHLDTGADGTHPMLKGAFGAFAEFNYIGKQVVPDPAPHDTDIHGTHTAGTIAGRPVNGHRMGVAPEASLVSGIVIEGGKVTFRILAGLNWILHQGVRVLSMSLGIPGKADVFLEITNVLREQGVLPVIAIGNEGPGTSRYPGNYATVLSVGAVDDRDQVASFSSSDKMPPPPPPARIVPDVIAPGVGVISCVPGNRYMSMDGTSMATPHMAGLAALLFQAKPGATPDQVEKAIFASCRRSSGMPADRANRGVPDAAVALSNL